MEMDIKMWIPTGIIARSILMKVGGLFSVTVMERSESRGWCLSIHGYTGAYLRKRLKISTILSPGYI